jgi:hypothetical protein
MGGDERPDVELARDLVAALAPGEQPLFPAIARAFKEDRDGKGSLRSGGDDILGFGLAEAATLLTPIALVAAKEALGYMAAEIGKELGREAAGEITTGLGRVDGLRRV